MMDLVTSILFFLVAYWLSKTAATKFVFSGG
jgi:hypothetical protein